MIARFWSQQDEEAQEGPSFRLPKIAIQSSFGIFAVLGLISLGLLALNGMGGVGGEGSMSFFKEAPSAELTWFIEDNQVKKLVQLEKDLLKESSIYATWEQQVQSSGLQDPGLVSQRRILEKEEDPQPPKYNVRYESNLMKKKGRTDLVMVSDEIAAFTPVFTKSLKDAVKMHSDRPVFTIEMWEAKIEEEERAALEKAEREERQRLQRAEWEENAQIWREKLAEGEEDDSNRSHRDWRNIFPWRGLLSLNRWRDVFKSTREKQKEEYQGLTRSDGTQMEFDEIASTMCTKEDSNFQIGIIYLHSWMCSKFLGLDLDQVTSHSSSTPPFPLLTNRFSL